MLRFIRKLIKSIPTIIIAMILAITAWLTAVSSSDPNEIHTYSQPISVEVLGQDASLIINGETVHQVTVSINAPKTVWQQLNSTSGLINAYIDLSGLKKGTHHLPVQIMVDLKPLQIVSVNPELISLTLEPLVAAVMPIQVVSRGEPAIGFQAEKPSMEPGSSRISGPESLVDQVVNLRATVDLTQTRESINTTLALVAVDVNGDPVDGVTITPPTAQIIQPITQKGGYRNVVVTVVSQGKLANGYRLTNISVSPPNITVFSKDPTLVESLPGYVETNPIPLDNLMADTSLPAALNLPAGVSLVGNQVVMVVINIEPIESSLTISRIPIIPIGLAEGLTVDFSPIFVDILISGPLPVLDILKSQEIQVTIDLVGKEPGTYQVIPIVRNTPEIRVESIIPGTIEVVITRKVK